MGWFLSLVTWWSGVDLCCLIGGGLYSVEKSSVLVASSVFLQYSWGCQGITGSAGLLYWPGKSCFSKHCDSFKYSRNENWLYSVMLANIPSPHKWAQAPVSLLLCVMIKSGMTWPHPSFFHRTSLSFSAQAGWCSMPGLVHNFFFPCFSPWPHVLLSVSASKPCSQNQNH